MFEWLSEQRSIVALLLILSLLGGFFASIVYGVRQTRRRAKDQVFGDPERTTGGWFWAVCGVSALLLVWFYYSWGAARAFFPHAANELCQVAKLHEAVSPLTSSLPIETRYSKSKTLLVRNMRQVDELRDRFPAAAFDATETALILRALDNSGTLMSMMATAELIDQRAVAAFAQIESGIAEITAKLATPPTDLMPSAAALAQPAWGIAEPEIPLLPISPRGMVFDQLAGEAASLSKNYLKIRNLSPAALNIIAATKVDIATVKKAAGNVADHAAAKVRQDYVKAVERIFRRVDDGKIFPDQATAGIAASLVAMFNQIDTAKGGWFDVETPLCPGSPGSCASRATPRSTSASTAPATRCSSRCSTATPGSS